MNTSKKVNPANGPEKADRARVPMSLPQLKLSVPDIPGYHLHWMAGNPARIAQATKAGYEFVEPEEVDVVNSGLANGAATSGNTDMGSRVSVVAGGDTGSDGQEQRLYLMKLKQEWWEADQLALEDRNEQTAASLRGGRDLADNPNGSDNRYIPEAHRKGVADLFTRKSRRA